MHNEVSLTINFFQTCFLSFAPFFISVIKSFGNKFFFKLLSQRNEIIPIPRIADLPYI